MHTIKNNFVIPTAGIDESNAGEYYILWPTNPLKAAVVIHEWLQKTFGVHDCEVIITDSHLKWT